MLPYAFNTYITLVYSSSLFGGIFSDRVMRSSMATDASSKVYIYVTTNQIEKVKRQAQNKRL